MMSAIIRCERELPGTRRHAFKKETDVSSVSSALAPLLGKMTNEPQLEHFSSQPGKIAIFRETSADHAPYRIGHPSAVDLEAAAARGPERFDAEAEMALPETARGCRCAPTDEKRNATAKYRQMNQILHKVAKRCEASGVW